CLGPASLAYADLLVDEFNEPARAVELLRDYRAKGLASRGDPIFLSTPGQVLFRIGEIQRSRLAAPREAAESFLDGLAEARAGGRDVEAYAYYYLAAGDCLAEAGDHRGAMSLYGLYQARSEAPLPELWGRWMACYLRVSPYFTISMGFTLLLTALSGVLAIVVLVSQWSRTRNYLLHAAVLTLLVGGTQVVVHGWALGVPKTDLLWTGLFSARTFLVVPAGMALAAAVGIRTPRARRAARSIAAGVVAGLVMGAITWAFLAWQTPRPSDLLQFLWDPLREGELGAILEPSRHPVSAVLLVMTAGVVEEITCRLFFLGLLVRSLRAVSGRWAISVFLVSFFWAIAHAGMVEPESWKLAQVFTLGLVLGVLAKREGILACIVAHALFNAVGVWV
ncbi:MAG: CPBP family intramembrane glutamic endopeptidase, partial [Planctomycetota bacterium]